jgi:SLBB domain
MRPFMRSVLATMLALSCASVAKAQNGGVETLFRAPRTTLATRVATLEGDFHVGDRFLFTLTIDSSRTDTVSVRDNVVVTVASLPDLSLKGVLRSELDGVLEAHILRYVKNARVRTVPLTSLSIVGAVGRPGFYWASPDRPLSELIMMAGGPAVDAKLREIEIRRAGKVTLKAKESRDALMRGYTVEQMDVRSGDEVRVPAKRKWNWQSIIQLMFVVSSLFFAGIQFLQWYYDRQE